MTVGARAQADLDLDRRVAAAVEDLAGVDALDLTHPRRPFSHRHDPDLAYLVWRRVTGTVVVCAGVLVCGVAVPVESPAGVFGAL